MSGMKLALGTAQFGLAYGIAGRGEVVPETEVRAILEDAAARGVTLLDTAAAYGEIETRIAELAAGLPLQFVSKIPAIPDVLPPVQAAEFALQSARRSLQRLGPALRTILLHRARDLLGERGDAVWPALSAWAREQGLRLGASGYTPDDAVELANLRGVNLVQLPGNALDQRVQFAAGRMSSLGIEVHLRSVFLQGLLLMPDARATALLPAAREALQRWHDWAARIGLEPLDAALAVVKSCAPVSTVVVGVDDLAQWRAIADAWERTRATPAIELAVTSPDVIDPRLWKAAT